MVWLGRMNPDQSAVRAPSMLLAPCTELDNTSSSSRSNDWLPDDKILLRGKGPSTLRWERKGKSGEWDPWHILLMQWWTPFLWFMVGTGMGHKNITELTFIQSLWGRKRGPALLHCCQRPNLLSWDSHSRWHPGAHYRPGAPVQFTA